MCLFSVLEQSDISFLMKLWIGLAQLGGSSAVHDVGLGHLLDCIQPGAQLKLECPR